MFWSVGKGTTLVSRFSDGNVPIDLRINRFLLSILLPYIPGGTHLIAKTIKRRQGEAVIKHQQYGLSTKESPLPFHGGAMLVNEELKYKLISGRVKCKGNLIRLNNRQAEFSDGTKIDDIDIVFFATGYNLDLSYVDDKYIQGRYFFHWSRIKYGKNIYHVTIEFTSCNLCNLTDLGRDRTTWPVYKWVFPIHQSHPSMALIALTPVGGPVPPLIEMHCRWATAVFSGQCKLPPKKIMSDFQIQRQNTYQKRSGGRFQVYSQLSREPVYSIFQKGILGTRFQREFSAFLKYFFSRFYCICLKT